MIDTLIVTATNTEQSETYWQRQPEWVWYDNETNYLGFARWSDGEQAAYIRADLVDEYVRLRDAR
jgi:hypothetical protein